MSARYEPEADLRAMARTVALPRPGIRSRVKPNRIVTSRTFMPRPSRRAERRLRGAGSVMTPPLAARSKPVPPWGERQRWPVSAIPQPRASGRSNDSLDEQLARGVGGDRRAAETGEQDTASPTPRDARRPGRRRSRVTMGRAPWW